MGKITVRYAGGSGAGVRFNLIYRANGNSEKTEGVEPQYVSDFIRSHRGCKLDTSDLTGVWPRRFGSARK